MGNSLVRTVKSCAISVDLADKSEEEALSEAQLELEAFVRQKRGVLGPVLSTTQYDPATRSRRLVASGDYVADVPIALRPLCVESLWSWNDGHITLKAKKLNLDGAVSGGLGLG